MRWLFSLLFAACTVAAGCGGAGTDDAAAPEAAALDGAPQGSLTVRGNALVNQQGTRARLLGVNHVTAEYMCINGQGIFDHPSDQVVVDALLAWHVNAVRVTLNEHCWLGIGALDPRYSGDNYRAAIRGFVSRLRARGLYVILAAQWSSSIPGKADHQQPMLDRANGVPFWQSMSASFGTDRGILFDIFSEPFLDVSNTNHAYDGDPWQCLQHGCIVHHNGETYEALGTQGIVDVLRGAGAVNVLLVPGLGYSNDLSELAAHMPHDPLGALAASFHTYPVTRCRMTSCWDDTLAPLAQSMPVIAGEIGEQDCAGGFIRDFMAWADAHGVSYLGWAFNTGDCKQRPALLASWDNGGTPTAFGAALREHLASVSR
jgi:hypothetical protein